MEIDKSLKTAMLLVVSVLVILISVGAYSIFGPIFLGKIDQVVDSGSIQISNVFGAAKNNGSLAVAGIYGVDIPIALRLTVTLLSVAAIVLVFGFLWKNRGDMFGGKGGSGGKGGVMS